MDAILDLQIVLQVVRMNKSPNKRITIDMWNREWDAVIERHPEVKITFIGEKL